MGKTFSLLALLTALVVSSCVSPQATSQKAVTPSDLSVLQTVAPIEAPKQIKSPTPVAPSTPPVVRPVPSFSPPPYPFPTPSGPRPPRPLMEEPKSTQKAKPPSKPGPAPQWVAHYDGPDKGVDSSQIIAVDPAGNVYVTGVSESPLTGLDYITIKYNSNGQQLWANRYTGQGKGRDTPGGLVVDEKGNVYVTGTRQRDEKSADPATIKYSQDGNQLWVVRNDDKFRFSGAGGIAVDRNGNIYVRGGSISTTASGGPLEYLILKYTSEGKLLWTAPVESSRAPLGGTYPSYIALDPVGNVYLAATISHDGRRKYMLVKHDANGNQLWKAIYNGPYGGDDNLSGLVIDSEGNALVTGASYKDIITSDAIVTRPEDDMATVKYAPDGKVLWIARFNGPNNGREQALTLAIDGENNIYVAGITNAPVTSTRTSSGRGDHNYFVVKYDSRGKQQWVAQYDGRFAETYLIPSRMALDKKGNVYLTGEASVSSRKDFFTAKYDNKGKEQWILHHEMSVRSVVVDHSGNVYALGTRTTLETKTDIVVVKYPAK